jgi:uncharacterized RDD family membrane protein YckC
VEASAAQNAPVTKTCLQCGAVQPSSIRVCNFCDSAFAVDLSDSQEPSVSSTRGNLALRVDTEHSDGSRHVDPDPAWRGELAQRLHAYRRRRRKLGPNLAQSQFSFEDSEEDSAAPTCVSVAEAEPRAQEDFAFTIAIGRNAAVQEDTRMVIDVSLPPERDTAAMQIPDVDERFTHSGLFGVASIDDRRLAALVDIACLLFAYGGFLTLFGSLGGQFTLSKLSAAVYAATFAIVYLQYFALFTVFGGTTPGMMLRHLQVVSFSGEPPTPRQMLLRSAGYMLSAGTFFLGFLWAMWDEDTLTWHDRLSRTYLSRAPTLADLETPSTAHSR